MAAALGGGGVVAQHVTCSKTSTDYDRLGVGVALHKPNFPLVVLLSVTMAQCAQPTVIGLMT